MVQSVHGNLSRHAKHYAVALSFGLAALSTSQVNAIDFDPGRPYPLRHHSGWHDPYFGFQGKQLTDLANITLSTISPTSAPRMSDAVRFLHRRADGNYLAIGRSEECDTDWNGDTTRDRCREVVSVVLYNRDGVRIDSVGMANRASFGTYFDSVPFPRLSGMLYTPAIGELVTGPYPNLPLSSRPEDSTMSPSGKAFVLAEEVSRGAGCRTYDQPVDLPPHPSPCLRFRRGAVLSIDSNLAIDLNFLTRSRSALQANAGSESLDGLESSCSKTYYTSIATNTDRIFIGGHREVYPTATNGRCNTVNRPAYTPFVLALNTTGRIEMGFASNGIWSPPSWPQSSSQGGVVSDLQLDAQGNLLVLAGRWLAPAGRPADARFTTVVLSITSAGQRRANFASNGELELVDMQFDPHARNMKLALTEPPRPPAPATNQAAYVFSRFGGQVAHIRDVATGLRNLTYGPSGTGLYASAADLAQLPAFITTGTPLLSDVVPVCTNGLALIGTHLTSNRKPMAVVLDGGGRRAHNLYDPPPIFTSPANRGTLFENYIGTMAHVRDGLGLAAMWHKEEGKLLIGGSAGRIQNQIPFGTYLPMFDFAISARQIRCVDVD